MPLKDRLRKIRDEVDNFIGGPPPTSYQSHPQQYQQQGQYQQQPYQQQYHQQQQQQPYPPPQQHYPQQGYPPQGYPQQQYHQGPGYFAPQQQHFATPPPPVPPHPPATEGVTSPPPIPSNKPGSPPAVPSSRPADVYWKPRLATDTHVSEAWDLKQGNADGWGNHELQHYTSEPQNAFHTPSGTLVVRAIANSSHPDPSARFTSARLVSRQTFSRDRGVLSATILAPCAKGIWPAFWLLPQEPFAWPVDGEVDIMETWNGDCENRSCLHWGQHNEPQKHRVLGTKVPDMASRVIKYELAWDQPDGKAGTGRMVWYMDGRPVMKADVPAGTRPLRDMTVLLNVAMGGDVCQGKKPDDGWYDLVVFDIHMKSEIDGGWDRFNRDWGYTPQGNTY